jgi:hypothetical protein
MKPQEKAKQLIETYLKMNDGLIEEFIPIPKEGAKQCALVAVEEIINANGLHPNDTNYDYNKAEVYWQEVKKEIQLL